MTLELDDELSNTSRMHIHVHASRANPNKKKKQHQDGGDQSRYNVRTSLQSRNQQQVNQNSKHQSPDLAFQNKAKAGWHS